MPVPEYGRQQMEWLRILAIDAEGRETLVGLSFEETEWFFRFLDEKSPTDADREKYLALHAKNEAARHRVLAAEHLERPETEGQKT